MIQIDQLTKHFGKVRALNNISSRYPGRTVFRLFGPEWRRKDDDHKNYMPGLLQPNLRAGRFSGETEPIGDMISP
jgi:ABC-type branched-subunit amino acid transport system ATPase component